MNNDYFLYAWNEKDYLLNPVGRRFDEWCIMNYYHNAPIPDHEEIYRGGEEVWVMFPDAMDLVECAEATGNYVWYEHGFHVGVMVDGKEVYAELNNVWKCEEDVE